MHEFACGSRPLDFAGTLRARREGEPFEFLTDATSLDDWLVQAGIRTDGAAATAGDFTAAIVLREAIYTLVWHRLNGEDYPPRALAHLNETAAHLSVVPRLEASGVVRDAAVPACLGELAREAVELLGGDDAALLRECARPECTQIYLDRSRGHRREWCSMRTCGNRAKAAAYRARHRDEEPAAVD